MIYISIFVAFIIIRFVGAQRAYWPILFGLFLFVAFRFEVGCDWSGYLNQYRVFGAMSLRDALKDTDPLWALAFVTQRAFDIPYPWINVFAGIMFFCGAHAVAKRQPDPLSFLILMFPVLIINMPMGAIRQSAAIGVMCFALLSFVDKRTVSYVVFVVIAAGLHSSAAVFLLLAPLAAGPITQKRLILAGFLALPGLALLLTGAAADVATTRYVETDVDAAGAIFRVLQVGLTGAIFLMFLRKRWERDDPFYRLALIGSLIMIAIPALLLISTVIGDRLAYYLLPIQAMIFARLPYLRLRFSRGLIILAPYLVLLATLAIWSILSSHFDQCFLPYQTWLFGYPTGGQWAY